MVLLPYRNLCAGCSRIVILLQAFLFWRMSAISAFATRAGCASSLSSRLYSSHHGLSSFAMASLRPSKRSATMWSFCPGPITARSQRSVMQMTYSTSSAASYAQSTSGKGFGKETDTPTKESWKIVDVPLVFVPGMKGTHLAFDDDNKSDGIQQSKTKKKKRAWLTLGNLLNFPPRPDNDPSRDLSLPLTYDYDPPANGEDGHEFASHYPRQHRGELVPDGIVDHIIELNVGSKNTTNYADVNFLPFYGHTTQMLRDIDKEYHARRHDGKVESTQSFQNQDDEAKDLGRSKGIFDRVGSFVERTSNWAFLNKTNTTAKEQQSHHSLKHCRPTAVFSYDWRRPLPELCTALNKFCEETFPGQPVQIIAHSLGGLMSFAAMRENPEKYTPGAVVVGVPFETGIQYLQDLHKGYFTELDRCRQFTPEKQFTMSSHWGFFPITKDRLEDRFVDVTERCESGEEIQFDADKSGIGKKASIQPRVEGNNAWFDFYDPDEWERLDIGIFGPQYDDVLTDEQRQAYKEHMRIQMAAAKSWRKKVLGEGDLDEKDFNAESFPPLVALASDAVPTVNQILRRRRKKSLQNTVTRKGRSPFNPWEYDYVNGRAVPGDGRIDYDKAFPPGFVSHKRIALDSPHAKQMCWEESGGSWGRIYEEVVEQAEAYLKLKQEEEERFANKDPPNLAIEQMLEKRSGGQRKSMMNRIASRARNARKRLRRRKLVKSGISDPDALVATVRPRRFSFRRKR